MKSHCGSRKKETHSGRRRSPPPKEEAPLVFLSLFSGIRRYSPRSARFSRAEVTRECPDPPYRKSRYVLLSPDSRRCKESQFFPGDYSRGGNARARDSRYHACPPFQGGDAG